jgi:hypothetical protein
VSSGVHYIVFHQAPYTLSTFLGILARISLPVINMLDLIHSAGQLGWQEILMGPIQQALSLSMSFRRQKFHPMHDNSWNRLVM